MRAFLWLSIHFLVFYINTIRQIGGRITMSNQYYVILTQKQIISKVDGNPVMEIQLVGVKDRELYKTYVSPLNRNFKHWSYIIHNPTNGYLVTGIKIKDASKHLISADSVVSILVATEDSTEVYQELISVWKRQDSTGHFDNLFG